MNIMDIDPIQVLIANQHQIKQISREFYRSATMLFGYANEIKSIANYENDNKQPSRKVSKLKQVII